MTYELSFWATVSPKLFWCNTMHSVRKGKNLRLKKKSPQQYHNSTLAPRRVINYSVLWYVVLLPQLGIVIIMRTTPFISLTYNITLT